MLFRAKEDLKGLPAGEAAGCKRGDAGEFKVVLSGLECVLASGYFPDRRDGGIVCLDKERIVVAAHGFVESCQLLRGEFPFGSVANFSGLESRQLCDKHTA